MEASEQESQLRRLIETVTGLDLESDLVRERELGVRYNFSGARELFQRVLEFAGELAALPLDLLPDRQIQSLAVPIRAINDQLVAIKGFDVSGQSDAPGAIERLTGSLTQALDIAREQWIPVIAYLRLQGSNVDEMIRQLRDIRERADRDTREALAQVQAIRTNVEQIQRDVQEAASRTGAGVYAQTFETEAETHEGLAQSWFRRAAWAGGFTLATAFVAVGLAIWRASDVGTSAALQIGIAKAAVLGVGAYATVSFNKLSRAHRHLAVTNRHRANALKVFRVFVDGTDEERVKDAVLLEATHTIFGQTASGFLDSAAEPERVEVLGASPFGILDGLTFRR
jgi:hypothetical protein